MKCCCRNDSKHSVVLMCERCGSYVCMEGQVDLEKAVIEAAVEFVKHYNPTSGDRAKLDKSDEVDNKLYEIVCKYIGESDGEI